MKIAALCNSLMGIPSLQLLAQSGRLAALGIPAVEHEATLVLRELAAGLNIPLTVFSKESFATDSENWLKDSGAGLVLVYTFPFRLSAALLALPARGCLNFHFGLLPQYRGADAIFWEIRNREPFGAVTVHQMESTLDTGSIALEQKVPIKPTDTYGLHMANLGMAGMQATHQLLPLLERDIIWQIQDESQARVWPKPGQREVLIDWDNMSAAEITALVRACNPWNKGAYTFLGNDIIRLTLAFESALGAGGELPGTLSQSPSGLLVACKDDESIVLETFYLDAGFFSGRQSIELGILPHMKFSTPKF